MTLEDCRLWAKHQFATLNRRALGPHVDSLMVQSDGFRFLIDPNDHGVGRQLRRHGHYGRHELDRLRPMIGPTSNVLVVGTHVGTLAIPIASWCRHVIGIEANPRTFGLVHDNAVLNGCKNLTLHQLAASDSDGEIAFLMSRTNSGGSKIAPAREEYRYRYDRPERVQVQTRRLDDVVVDRSIDVIMMDIEGSEPMALRGMPRILRECTHLVIEFVPHHLRDVSQTPLADFVSLLSMFQSMHIPRMNRTYGNDEFEAALRRLYDHDLSEDAVVMSKHAPDHLERLVTGTLAR